MARRVDRSRYVDLTTHLTFDLPSVKQPGEGLLLRFSLGNHLRTIGPSGLLPLLFLYVGFLALPDPAAFPLIVIGGVLLLLWILLLWRAYAYFNGAYLRLSITPEGRWLLRCYPPTREALADAEILFSVHRIDLQGGASAQAPTEIHRRRYHLLDHLLSPTEEGSLAALLPAPNPNLPGPGERDNISVTWQLTYVHRPGLLPAFRTRWNLPAYFAFRHAAPRRPDPTY